MRKAHARAVLVASLLACCPCGFALDPSLDINQYAHKAWTIRDGFFNSLIQAIAQTPDGYLWLGTPLGLLRFDGVRTVAWQPPPGERLPDTSVSRLLVTRDGRLWIGTVAGLASWKDGTLVHYAELAGQVISALVEDRGGTVWAGGIGIPASLCAIQSVRTQCYGQDGSLGRGVSSLFEENGNLWVGAATGLWRWEPGRPKRYAMAMPNPSNFAVYDLNKGDGGPLLMALLSGIRRLSGEKAEAYSAPGDTRGSNRLLRDRDGGLWIGTLARGLLHVHQGRTDLFTRLDGLSGDDITALFEDREGNVWVGTLGGLDRFHNLAVPTISENQGLSSDGVMSALGARDGSVWVGTQDGLNRWHKGQITTYRKHDGLPDSVTGSLFEDDRGRIWASTLRGIAILKDDRFVPLGSVSTRVVYNIAEERAGSFWINDQDQGLIHLLDEKVVERIPWSMLGHKDHATALVRDPKRGGFWLGFYLGGVIFFKNGQIRESYGTAEGLGGGRVADLQLYSDGSVWAATDGGLSRIRDEHVATLNTRSGLPCDTVYWMIEDGDQSAWLCMSCGLARISRAELEAWIADPNRTVKNTVFDNSDGVTTHNSGLNPHVATSADGRLWFASVRGLSVVDPHHLPVNKLPPLVHIEQITADRKKHDATSNLHLPPLVRDLEIDYTALSLVAPEKIRFRVKLEGHDPDWKDAGNERKAFYSDLPPRNYRFRVAACNNSGVWNEAGASFDFSIDPAYYQTRWFQALSVGAFLAVLWGVHWLRLHQIAQQFNARLDERVNERTRIARELHDTLLQSFHGLLFRFQAVDNLLPSRPGEAKQTLESALDDAAQAITEARDAVHELRSSAVVTNDLAAAVTALGEELAGHPTTGTANQDLPTVLVEVEGTPQDLHPILRDEIYRIAGEALRNAFHHARARRIEVEIRYDDRELRVRVRDDGSGIDPSILNHEGRAGHWGLTGMRERAKRIGGQMDVWSELGAGTEVELRIPASIGYQTYAGRGILLFRKTRLFRKKTGASS
jgi:signal transduction histidine kinase/ligand-binding sensor domain-containing protein